MYPAQTSLIPVYVALGRFLEENGLSAIFGLYPYWYLGTTPFRYLSGPILPVSLTTLHKIFPNFTLFEIFFLIIAFCWALGAIGVYLLVKGLGGERKIAILSAFFYFFGPIIPLTFRFSNGLYLTAFSLLPFILLLYLGLLKNWTKKGAFLLFLSITFVILLDSLALPTLILGMATIFLACVGWKKTEEKLKQAFLIFAFSFLISSFWYGPGYWLTLLGASSFGGKSLLSVIAWLGKLAPTVFAFVAATVSVKFFKKRNLLRDFCFYWLFIFGFLTMVRFLSDPKFWLDWIAYGGELQLGLAITMGMVIDKISNIKKFSLVVALSTLYFILFTVIFSRYVLGTLQKDITNKVEYRISQELSKIVEPGGRVFLSGSSAFWLNAFFDIPQVRGGVDQVATHPTWDKVAWEVREGEDVQKSLKWLKELGVNYLVVHTADSKEYYHDFKYPEKFEGREKLEKIYEGEGDRIYRLLN